MRVTSFKSNTTAWFVHPRFRLLVLAGGLAVSIAHLGCTPPSWAAEAESIAGVVVDAAGAAVSIADPAAAPLITAIEKGFGAVISSLQAAQASQDASTLAQVTAAMNTANQDVQALEVAVKNPNTSAEIAAFSSVCVAALNQIQNLIPSANASAKAPVKAIKASEFKKRFNAAFKGDKNWKPSWHNYTAK